MLIHGLYFCRLSIISEFIEQNSSNTIGPMRGYLSLVYCFHSFHTSPAFQLFSCWNWSSECMELTLCYISNQHVYPVYNITFSCGVFKIFAPSLSRCLTALSSLLTESHPHNWCLLHGMNRDKQICNSAICRNMHNSSEDYNWSTAVWQSVL